MLTLPPTTIRPRSLDEDEEELDALEQLIRASQQLEQPEPLPPRATAAREAYMARDPEAIATAPDTIRTRTDRPPEMLPEDNLGVAGVPQFDPRSSGPAAPPGAAMPPPQQTPPSQPSYQDVAGRMEQRGPGTGERPNLFGHEDEVGFSRDKAIADMQRVQTESGERPQQQPTSRWEDELVKRGGDVSDDQLASSWVLGLFGGGQDFALKHRQQQLGQREQYRQELMKARELDAQENAARMPAGDAMEQAIAGTGAALPESLRGLPMSHPLVKAYANGLYSQGNRAEGQQLSYQKKILDLESKAALAEQDRASRERVAQGNNNATVQAAGLRGRRGAGGGDGAPRNVNDLLASQVMEVGGLPDFATAQQVVATGDLSAVPETRRSNVQRTLVEYKHLLETDPGKAGQVIVDRQKKGGTADDALAQHVTKMQSDPKYAYKTQTEITDTASSLKSGISAWNRMTPEDKKAFVQLSPLGTGAIAKSGLMSPEGKALSGAVLTVMNELVKERAGSAVTESEWGRVASEIGLATGSWDPFNSTQGVDDYLGRARDRVLRHRKDYESIMGGWK